MNGTERGRAAASILTNSKELGVVSFCHGWRWPGHFQRWPGRIAIPFNYRGNLGFRHAFWGVVDTPRTIMEGGA